MPIQAEYTGRLNIDAQALRRMMFDPLLPLARDLERRGVRVASQAKQNASGRPGPRVRTGRLRASIRSAQARVDAVGMFVDVGSDVHYSRYVEMGTERSRPYPYLRPAIFAAR